MIRKNAESIVLWSLSVYPFAFRWHVVLDLMFDAQNPAGLEKEPGIKLLDVI